MRILVFDDDLCHQPDFFGGLPAEFVYRPHADRAVEDVREIEPDLVLMDYAMGRHRTGVEAVSDLRETFPPGDLLIFGISSDEGCNRRMCRAGADDGVLKGAAPALVHQLVRRLVREEGGEGGGGAGR